MKKLLILISILCFSLTMGISQDKTITKEQIIQLSLTSPAAANILKAEYPELFENDPSQAEDLSKIDVWQKFTFILSSSSRVPLIERVPGGQYANKGFLLNRYWDWRIVIDDLGRPVLVPFKRTVKI